MIETGMPAQHEIEIRVRYQETDGQGEPVNAERHNAFRTRYRMHPIIPLIGGYTGRLADGGERVQLQRPDDPLPPPPEEPPTCPSPTSPRSWTTSARGR